MSGAPDKRDQTMNQDQLLGLDESHLILVGRGPHRLTAATAAAFNDMQVAAAHAGFNLQAASSWRGFERQLAIWNGKWRGERPLLDAHNQPIDALQLSDDRAPPRHPALERPARHQPPPLGHRSRHLRSGLPARRHQAGAGALGV